MRSSSNKPKLNILQILFHPIPAPLDTQAETWRRTFRAYEEAYSLDGACTNWAEEFFGRMRRAEVGHHHRFAGPYLLRYAQEASWREDHLRLAMAIRLAWFLCWR